jgi:non-ribosomal peptide synthetase component F
MSSNASVYLDSELESEREYWLQKLSGELVVTGIPLDFTRPKAFAGRKGTADLALPAATQQKALELCGGNELLVFTVLLAALSVCLHKYSGQEDIIVGTTIHEQYREMAAFNKVLAIRARVSGELTARELLLEVKQALADAYANQKYPLDRLTKLLNVELPDNRAPLFNVVAVLENVNDRENIADLKHDLTLIFSARDGGLEGQIEYNVELFPDHSEQSRCRNLSTGVADGSGAKGALICGQ